MQRSQAESENLTRIEYLTLTAHLLAALSTALMAVASALRSAREGRLHERPLSTAEQPPTASKPYSNTPRDYFDI
jgi:hypothetical protein